MDQEARYLVRDAGIKAVWVEVSVSGVDLCIQDGVRYSRYGYHVGDVDDAEALARCKHRAIDAGEVL